MRPENILKIIVRCLKEYKKLLNWQEELEDTKRVT
jgi:hypothetical protein